MPKFERLQTARYALKREVATTRSVFPWSMSDFKPGEVRKLQKSTMKHAVPLFVAEQRGVAAEGALSTYSRTIDLRRKTVCVPVFFGETEETPGRVCKNRRRPPTQNF